MISTIRRITHLNILKPWLVVRQVFLILAIGLVAISSGTAQTHAANGSYSFEIKDRDADSKPDATLETPRLRLMLSGATGNIAVYFLRGLNFEETLFPPILTELGYKIATSSLRPFFLQVGGKDEIFPSEGYTFELASSTTSGVTIVARGSPNSSGLQLTKTYEFPIDSYATQFRVGISNRGKQDLIIGSSEATNSSESVGLSLLYGPGLFLDPFTPSTFLALQPLGQESHEKVEGLLAAAKKAKFSGIGVKTTYFCALMECRDPVNVNLSAQSFEVKSDDPQKRTFQGEVIGLSLPVLVLKPGEEKVYSFSLYLGPKFLDELMGIGRAEVTDYGFLSTMLLRVLQFFHQLYPNYGLAIIFLTLVVRAALYPLTLKQTKSMAQMQKIQPMLQDIKDRHRDNPQKFNEEVLKLYQKHDVNPLGGCLPLLLQLPVLIALYNTINIAVELRKVHFLWLADLSKADPYLILPLVIAVLMYVQQGKMPDPQQQQMMAFMPMFMFIITWTLPSGLLLYWFTSSVVGVFQQLQANKLMAKIKEE